MLLLIDNYDSFTYNLYDYFRQLGYPVHLVKNDHWQLSDIVDAAPQAIIFSPGPGEPNQAGITLAAIKQFAGVIPMLGVCLGHQAIAQAFGARIIRAPAPVHGKTSLITHDGKTLFSQLPNPLRVTRYHSLIVDPTSLPDEFEISARSDDQLIMALRHKTNAIESVQFHPEAILTECGKQILRNFVMHYLQPPLAPEQEY